jgi:hypothetical protein
MAGVEPVRMANEGKLGNCYVSRAESIGIVYP